MEDVVSGNNLEGHSHLQRERVKRGVEEISIGYSLESKSITLREEVKSI